MFLEHLDFVFFSKMLTLHLHGIFLMDSGKFYLCLDSALVS